MRSSARARHVVVIILLLALAGLAPTAAARSQVPARTFSLGQGIRVAAPAPGYGVAASAITTSGADLDLVLETGTDGVTRIVSDTPATAAVTSPASSSIARSTDPCKDGKYDLLPFKWKSTWEWWFQRRSTPAEIGRAAAEGRLRSAVSSITGERNDCGRPDTVNATSRYLGPTRMRPAVNSDTSCGKFDGRNVVGFGSLPPNVLGLTCTRYQVVLGVDSAVESDVLFNKRWFDWATSPRRCDHAALLRSIATHEFGHVYGLGHVDEQTHPNLTMSTAIGACDDSASTLGLGDMRGLEKRY